MHPTSEKAMASLSSTLAWKIPWTEEPGRLQSMGSLESDTTERLHFHFSLTTFKIVPIVFGFQYFVTYLDVNFSCLRFSKLLETLDNFLILLHGESHEWRSLVGCSPWGRDWATSLSLFTFMHWRRKWQPTPVFLPGEFQGRGSMVGCRLWGRTEADTTEAT